MTASFVIGLATGAAQQEPASDFPPQKVAPGIWQVGSIAPKKLTESSGVICCSWNTNVFWTHNDGRRQTLYAITRTGQLVAQYHIAASPVLDWEDIARDDQGHLYLADVGNNDGRRQDLFVYQFDEPDLKESGGKIPVNASWQLRYPAGAFDCESCFIWKDHGYLISKVFKDARAAIYRFPLEASSRPVHLEFLGTLPVTSPVTGADISTDGKRIGLVSKRGAYLFQIDGDVTRVATATSLHAKFRQGQIEGCCFVPEGLLATSEQREIFLFTNEAFRR